MEVLLVLQSYVMLQSAWIATRYPFHAFYSFMASEWMDLDNLWFSVEEELNQRPCHNLDSDVCVEQEEILGPVLLCMQVIFFSLDCCFCVNPLGISWRMVSNICYLIITGRQPRRGHNHCKQKQVHILTPLLTLRLPLERVLYVHHHRDVFVDSVFVAVFKHVTFPPFFPDLIYHANFFLPTFFFPEYL